MFKKILAFLLTLLLAAGLFSGCSENAGGGSADPAVSSGSVSEVSSEITSSPTEPSEASSAPISSHISELPSLDEDGAYTSKEDVALYLQLYGKLPHNFITKSEARALGWSGGSLEPYAPGCCIGGDRFGNYEELLPEGHTYTECDIDTLGANSRGAKRIVFSEDGLIYYTEDHYESFVLLYGEE